MVEPWNVIDERAGTAGHLRVTVRRFTLPDGSRAEWDIFGPAESVAAFAITPEREVVLARQYRPGPDAVLDELPGGVVDPGEHAADAAARELLEETGYAGAVLLVGETWLSSACRTRRWIAVVRDAQPVAEPRNDPQEPIDVVLVGLDDFRDHLRRGRLTDVGLGYLALDHLGLL
jgi:ADP-ribose pyrophosphatase